MSIFRKTMKALGFSGEDDEFEAQPYTAEILRMHVFGKRATG